MGLLEPHVRNLAAVAACRPAETFTEAGKAWERLEQSFDFGLLASSARSPTRAVEGEETNDWGFGFITKAGMAVTLVSLVGLVYIAAANSGVAGQPRCFGVDATIVGTNGPNEIHGTAGRDVIVARGGADEIEGRGGNDLICAGGGNDHAEGDRGNDRIAGSRGNDELEGDRGADVLRGGPGFDEGSGGPGNDRCVSIEHRESC